MLGVEVGIGDGPEHHRRGHARHVRQQTVDSGRRGAVVYLVDPRTEYPGLGIQGTAPGQVTAIGQDFAVGAGVAGRIEADTERTRGHGQAIGTASDRYRAGRHPRAGAVVVGAQHHVAGSDRGGGRHIDIAPANCSQVAGGDGGGGIQVDVLDGGVSEVAGGRGDSRAHRHVAPGVGRQTAVRAGDGLVQIDIARGVQGQRGGRGPGDGGIDIDVAQAATADASIRRGDVDVAATQCRHQIGHIDIGRIDTGVWRKHATAGRGTGSRSGRDRDVGRIEQPGAKLSLGRPGIDAKAVHIQLMRRGFDQAAVAALGAATRRDPAMGLRRVIGP